MTEEDLICIRMPHNINPDLHTLFEPRSIALVGASRDMNKGGGMFLSSLVKNGYRGKIYPVNPRESEIMSLKCYPSVPDIPEAIELAIIAIPARAVAEAMAQCSHKGAKFAIVHSSGFGELGDEGKLLQEQMLQAARAGGIRVVGPNCMGIYSPKSRINTVVPHHTLPAEAGGVAFVGQSGWVSENFLLLGHERGLSFSSVVSIGNQSDLTIEDFVEYFGRDPDTRVIAAYIEGLRQPGRFLKLAGEVCRRKPVIVWKGGSTGLGARAAASHTGSLAGNYALFEVACRQQGLTIAQSLEELVDLAVAFSCPHLPPGKKIGLLMEAGGGTVAGADACVKAGLSLPSLPEEAQQRLRDFLKGKTPPSPSLRNPIDLVWSPPSEADVFYATCLEIVFQTVDACLMITYTSLDDARLISQLEHVRDRVKKPVMVVPGHSTQQARGMRLLIERGIPTFTIPERAVRTIAAMARRSEYLGSLRHSLRASHG